MLNRKDSAVWAIIMAHIRSFKTLSLWITLPAEGIEDLGQDFLEFFLMGIKGKSKSGKEVKEAKVKLFNSTFEIYKEGDIGRGKALLKKIYYFFVLMQRKAVFNKARSRASYISHPKIIQMTAQIGTDEFSAIEAEQVLDSAQSISPFHKVCLESLMVDFNGVDTVEMQRSCNLTPVSPHPLYKKINKVVSEVRALAIWRPFVREGVKSVALFEGIDLYEQMQEDIKFHKIIFKERPWAKGRTKVI
jgi:hypothetical protein